MGVCRYCGESAGFLHHVHEECEQKHLNGCNQITSAVDQALASPTIPESLPQSIEQIATQSYIEQPERRALVAKAWMHSLDKLMEHGLPDEAEESKLIQLMNRCSMTRDELNGPSNSYDKLVEAGTLREVMHGHVPKRINISGTLPLNLQKNEQVVWLFQNVGYLEDRTRRQYVGRSAGVSVRIV